MISGNCLCGNVRYEITGKMGDIVHCHCQTCRKAHAAAFSSVAAVNDTDFRLLGSEWLKYYQSSPGKRRYFCTNCGSQIYAKRDNTAHIILRLGCLNDTAATHELKHIWVSQKAGWYSINNNLPEYARFD
ncbi:MAG: hypothetical protein CVV11_13885 [Gammaproteobacteria bacterium HGW-Gammaproteobacteria-15]|nr:MAG: hypothetical protein CVV11_13885 [Gammaproteobacteria bacterium HGW-Gammaproteobacteria-15]